MKKSALIFLTSSLAIMGCSKSGDSSGNAAIPVPYGTLSAGNISGVYGYWQLDSVRGRPVDAAGLVHLENNRVMAESLALDPSMFQRAGFPADLVHEYRGPYQIAGQTLILGQGSGINGVPGVNPNGMNQPQMNSQINQQMNRQLPSQQFGPGLNQVGNDINQVMINVINANEITISDRHFHRIDQMAFARFISNLTQVEGQEGDRPATRDTRPFRLPDVREEHKGGVPDRDFPRVALPERWDPRQMAETPKSGFELHMAGTKYTHEVYLQAEDVYCESSAANGLVVSFATSAENTSVNGVMKVPPLNWSKYHADRKEFHHFHLQETLFFSPITIEEQVSHQELVGETWKYSNQEDGGPILDARRPRPDCAFETFTPKNTGMLRVQMRCDSVPVEYRVRGIALRHDEGTVTLQFSCSPKPLRSRP